MDNELDKLIEAKEVCGHKVKPWTLGQIASLIPVFERVAFKMREAGIGLSTLEKNADKLAFAIVPDLPFVMHVTLKIPLAEASEMDIAKATQITIVIITQNIQYLKNLLSPVAETVKEIVSSGLSNS
jgi:hypothetical protein